MNKLGQTALIKAAIQGRANCARILLKAGHPKNIFNLLTPKYFVFPILGADPFRRDNGRQLTALEWAKFVGRAESAQAIGEFMGAAKRRGGAKQQQLKLQNTAAQDNFKQVAELNIEKEKSSGTE